MRRKRRLEDFVPTPGEWAWFFVWTALVAALVFVAKTHFSPAAAEQRMRDQLAQESAWPGPFPTYAEPTIQPAPDAKEETAPKDSAETVPQRSKARRLDRKTGWNPDAKETAGDARRIHPEEVKWLQGRLDAVVVEWSLPSEGELNIIRQIADRVGKIPYVAQNHGWGLPEDTLARNQGDCADKSLLLAERLIAAGVEEVAICKGVGPEYTPGEAGHAWVQATIDGQLWRIEATNGEITRANSGSPLDHYEAIATIWRVASSHQP